MIIVVLCSRLFLEQCQKIDYTLYHLDGVGAMHHLPLLEIEELNAINGRPVSASHRGGSRSGTIYSRGVAQEAERNGLLGDSGELKPLLDHIRADSWYSGSNYHNGGKWQ